jgi:hypothetical protein
MPFPGLTLPSTVVVARAAALAACCTWALGACAITSDDDKQSGAKGTSSSSPSPSPSSPSPSATVTVTESATPSASPPSPPTPTATSTGPDGALLTGSELPGLNDSARWTEGRTGPAGQDEFGLCQKFDLLSIGATTVVQRDFTSGEDTAGQQVADFADAQTAVRAARVLQSWHDSCRGRVKGTGVRVSPFRSVPVSAGTGQWYVVSYEAAGDGHFHVLGIARNGTRMSVLKIAQTGQDRNYEPGQDPMELAVKAAAAKLGG